MFSRDPESVRYNGGPGVNLREDISCQSISALRVAVLRKPLHT